MKKIRLLIVTTGYPRFSGDTFGVFVQDTANGLHEADVEVSILAPHEAGLPFKRNETGVTVYRLPYFPYKASLAYGSGIPSNISHPYCKIQLPFFMSFMAFWTFILSFKFDIIHGQWSVSAFFSILTRFIHGTPTVVTYQGSDLNSKGLLRKISKYVSEKVDCNFCVSSAQQEAISPMGSILCPSLIDTNRFKLLELKDKVELRKKMGFSAQNKIALFVGGLVPVKRVDLLINSMMKIERDVKLLIVGDGKLRDELQELVKELNLSDRIFFIGPVPYQEIHRYYQIADIHLLASISEGRPNVIYQAMSCSIPSVSTAVGGVPEMVCDKVSGVLVDPDVDSFSEAINSLFLTEGKLEKLGQQARLKLNELQVDKESVVQNHLKVYKELLQ